MMDAEETKRFKAKNLRYKKTDSQEFKIWIV